KVENRCMNRLCSALHPGRGSQSWISGHRRVLLLGLVAAGLFAVMTQSGPAGSSAAETGTGSSIERACPIAWGRLGGPDQPAVCEYHSSDPDPILGSLIGRGSCMIVISAS